MLQCWMSFLSTGLDNRILYWYRGKKEVIQLLSTRKTVVRISAELAYVLKSMKALLKCFVPLLAILTKKKKEKNAILTQISRYNHLSHIFLSVFVLLIEDKYLPAFII